jgi:hypothetical protein
MPKVEDTVLLNSIRQSRVTGVLDVTNFATLSRVTEALDEYAFRHGRFKILVRGCLEQFSSLPTRFLAYFKGFWLQISQISWFRASSIAKNAFSRIT